MKPIRFTCSQTFDAAPESISRQILDIARWPAFRGFGPLPGIRAAELENLPDGIVGGRIRVTNTDGSTHVEEILEWDPERRVRLRLGDFSPPLARLATSFEETWEFVRIGDATLVDRSFTLHPRSSLTRPLLGMIALLLRRAVARHLQDISKDAASGATDP